MRLFIDIVGVFFFQAEDGIRDLVRSRGLGDVYKRQIHGILHLLGLNDKTKSEQLEIREAENKSLELYYSKNKPEPHFYDQVYDLSLIHI